MSSEELRTWLGLRLADLLIYLSAIPLIAMYLLDDRAIEFVLAVVAVLLGVAACLLGMRSSPEVSGAANVGKKIAYPFGVAFILLVIGYHNVKHYQIPQNGMYPGMPAGSRLFALRKPYADSTRVSRGDIVVFTHSVKGTEVKFIWRVVGLPGDSIETSATEVVLNGQALPLEETRREGTLVISRETNGNVGYEVAYDTTPPATLPPDRKIVVPEGHFFVMGDNRHNAVDSRYIGSIPFESIVGKKW